MSWTASFAVAMVLASSVMAGCSTAPRTRADKDELLRQAAAALKEWNLDVPGVEAFAGRSYGYAVFPAITKAGIGVGGAYGRGVVYEQGRHIGYADVSHGSLGLQVGGQAYQELVVFDDRPALERFTQDRLDFSADTSGVLFRAGYVASVRFGDGVTLFFRPIGGAMGDVSMGGRRFTFVPKDDGQPTKGALPAAGTR